MAPPARLELTTLRLGGARSIQVSYGGLCPIILADFLSGVKNPCQSRGIFSATEHIMGISAFIGGEDMETNDAYMGDVDDLIFAEEEYYPSDR